VQTVQIHFVELLDAAVDELMATGAELQAQTGRVVLGVDRLDQAELLMVLLE